MVDPPKARRVLIVEDEYYIAAELEAALQSQGAEIVALSGELSDALNLAMGGGFDAAVIDLNLHNELAFSLADKLVEQHIPFVIATGYSAEVIPKRFSAREAI